jgi:uncharacterized membrane protein YbaN (DUF454 family)
MTTVEQDSQPPQSRLSRLQRWLLVAAGVALVGIGAVGVFLPGLPTTVFLLGASWCFARSCPWLEDRLIRVPLFRPFLGPLDGSAPMSRRGVLSTLLVMWTAITFSAVLVNLGEHTRPALTLTIVVLGLIGSFFVVRLGRRRSRPQPEEESSSTKLQSAPDVKT